MALGGRTTVGDAVGFAVGVSAGVTEAALKVASLDASLDAAPAEASGPPPADLLAAGPMLARSSAIPLRAGARATNTNAATPTTSSGSNHHALNRRNRPVSRTAGSDARDGAGIGFPQA